MEYLSIKKFSNNVMKGKLNSDGQQFYQNQQNKQPSLTLNHRTQRKDHD